MIDGIFTRLKPKNNAAVHKTFANAHNNTSAGIEVNIEDLTAALTSVSGEIELAHSSFQKLYEEANYIYSRLDHMEKNYTNQQTAPVKEEDEGGVGTSSVVIKKILFTDTNNSSVEGKLAKIQQAKQLTRNLLDAIEFLSEKVKNTSKASVVAPASSATRSTPRFEMK